MDIERDIDLDGEITSHRTNAATIGIFEATEVRLVSLVKEVLTDEGELYAVVAVEVEICAEGEIADSIIGRGCLGVLEGEEVVLTEVILHAESDVRATEMMMQEVRQFVAEIKVPARSGNHREIVHIFL